VKTTELTAALDAFGNSLCIRRRLDAHEENDTKLKRDITFTLDRIGRATLDLGDQSAAADDYFESLAIRRQLSKGDPDNRLYLSDIATSLERIGDMYQSTAPEAALGSGLMEHTASGRLELALAFYEKALDTRKQLSPKKAVDKAEDKELSTLEKKIEGVRARIDDKSKLVGTWWIEPVHAEEEDFTRRQQVVERETSTCWAQVQKTVEGIGNEPQLPSPK
jgi:tetratricopeptide (TPR) repeat protein